MSESIESANCIDFIKRQIQQQKDAVDKIKTDVVMSVIPEKYRIDVAYYFKWIENFLIENDAHWIVHNSPHHIVYDEFIFDGVSKGIVTANVEIVDGGHRFVVKYQPRE